MATRLTPLAAASTIATALTLAALPAAPAHAGGITVSGRVLTWSGTGLAGTTVTATYTSRGVSRVQAVTDGGGWFTFAAQEDTDWTFSVSNGWQEVLATAHVTSKPVSGVVIQLNDAPAAPASVTATATGTTTTATVSWTPPASDGGTPIHAYHVEAFNPGQPVSDCNTPITVTTCTLGGLTPGQSYNVSVMARNNVGWGKRATAWVTTPTPPPAPQAPPAAPVNPAQPDPYSASAPAPSSNPAAGRAPRKATPKVRLSAGRQQPRKNRLTVRWTSRNSRQVTLTWRRGNGRAHTQTTAPSGRITLAGPDGTRYRVTVKAGKARAHKTYRIK